MAKKHTLIIGQGLAGTTLAHRLIQRGVDVLIADDNRRQSSSLVAAGLWNPVVFRRMNKSWMADELLDAQSTFYPKIEEIVGAAFYKPKAICRQYGSQGEANLWMEKKTLPGFQRYLLDNPIDIDGFEKSEFGSGEVGHAGYLQIENYLIASAQHFQDKQIYFCEDVNLNTVRDFDSFSFHGYEIEHIIDCSGSRSNANPIWDFLPFNLTKGEVLTIHAPEFNLTQIFNAGFFILPIGDDKYRVGSTFEWKNIDELPTEFGKETLVNKVKKWTDIPFEVIGHKAGIRPTVKDRRPLLGVHPDVSNLFVFNGMGAKCVMIAPYFSEVFSDFVLEGKPLPPDVDIARFL